MKLFAIRNKETGEFWKTYRGKVSWSQRGHAKNAWNVAQPWNYPHKFDDQDELEVVECVLVERESYDALILTAQQMMAAEEDNASYIH